MLKFVLRLFVVLAVGFVISNEIVDRSANYLFEPVSDAYTRESVRGQIHSLVQELSRIEPASRQTHIDDQLAPYYGLRLRVVNARDYNASDRNGRPSARAISSSATRCRPSWPASRARAASGWSSSCRPNRRSDPG